MASANNETPESNNAAANVAPKKKPANILASDLLIVDSLISMPDTAEMARYPEGTRVRYQNMNAQLNTLLAKYNANRGQKIPLSLEEYHSLATLAEGLPDVKKAPGGSSMGILTTVKGLLGNEANIDFLGAAGQGADDNIITDELAKNGINIIPNTNAYAAQTFIFTDPDGKRTYATYPGTAPETLKADFVTDDLVSRHDTVFIPASIWGKLGKDLPEALLKKAWEQDKQIYLSIPRQARFGKDATDDVYQRLLSKADVTVVDENSLIGIYKTNDLNSAIARLQSDVAKNSQLRVEAGKSPKLKPATVLIKHNDDSATVLVAASAPGITPATPAAQYTVPPPKSLKDLQHSLGVDDAIYAGFFAGQIHGLSPRGSADFAMKVAEVKNAYSEARKIPSPVDNTPKTQEQWKHLRTELNNNALSDVGSAVSYARTGVENPVDKKLPKTKGMWVFDNILFNITNLTVFGISVFATYQTTYSSNQNNWLKRRGDNFRNYLQSKNISEDTAKNFNMILWSFTDGSIMAPFVAYLETKRNSIARWIDDRLGSTAEDKSVYEKQPHQGWKSVALGRASAFGIVIPTFFILKQKWIGKNATEKTSLNSVFFDKPAAAVMKRNFLGIPKAIQKMGFNENQTEGLIGTSFFETFYTTVCTTIMFLVSAMRGKKHTNNATEKEASNTNETPQAPSSEEFASIAGHHNARPSPEAYKRHSVSPQAAKFSDRAAEESQTALRYQ